MPVSIDYSAFNPSVTSFPTKNSANTEAVTATIAAIKKLVVKSYQSGRPWLERSF